MEHNPLIFILLSLTFVSKTANQPRAAPCASDALFINTKQLEFDFLLYHDLIKYTSW